MRLALAQINPLVGDIQGNSEKILLCCQKAAKQKANLLLTPELSLWGYPPRDLLLNALLIDQQQKALNEIAETIAFKTRDLKVLIGIAEPTLDLQFPKLFNSIVLIDSAGWRVVARKQLLPSYDVFDENRYFRPAEALGSLKLNIGEEKWHLGITICEDLWVEEKLQEQRIAGPNPIAKLAEQRIDLLINLSASPFSHDKASLRKQLASKAVERLQCPLVYLNQIGGNDELIFDGSSFILDSKSELILSLPNCQEAFAIWDTGQNQREEIISTSTPQEQLFNALVLGVTDYAHKCHFKSALIGLSGGIDSALVTTIATAALGAKNIIAILMPSPWSSEGSIKDALGLANRLGITTQTLPIGDLMHCFDSSLDIALGSAPKGITAENLQSRIRGTLLMALANEEGHLLLSTGNKSELAVGYCTLYGDMNGGLSVIGDLYKTSVFEICKWLDSDLSFKCRTTFKLPLKGEIIGKQIINKPPSAELRPNQVDSDSLPAYEILDPILKALIENRSTVQELINSGNSPTTTQQIEQLIKTSEFKRRQAPPLLKVSTQAFGTGWRLPIAAK